MNKQQIESLSYNVLKMEGLNHEQVRLATCILAFEYKLINRLKNNKVRRIEQPDEETLQQLNSKKVNSCHIIF
jgi:hypothetical protein